MISEPETAPPPAPDPVEKATPGAAEQLTRVLLALCILLALAIVFFACLVPIDVTDFWWQAKTGELIVKTGHVPNQDPFSWTAPGQRWLVHEWLTEVFFYLAYTRLPHGVLVFYKCGLGVLACGLVMWRSWLRSGSVALALAAGILTGFVLRNYADLRPQMVTFVLLAGLLLALDEYHEGRVPQLPWALPIVFLLWANLHGGVVVGLALIALWVGGEIVGAWLFRTGQRGLGRLAAGVGLSCLAVMLNPNGWEIYRYPFLVLGHPQVIDYITEWWSPSFHNPAMFPFEVLLLATLGVKAVTPRGSRERFGEAVILVATAYAALMSQRNTVPFAIAAAPAVAGGLALLWRAAAPLEGMRELGRHPAVRAEASLLLAILLVPVLVLQLPTTDPLFMPGQHFPRVPLAKWRLSLVPAAQWFQFGIGMSDFPQTAVDAMAQGAWPGRLYNDYVWGGYVIWRLSPQRKVFIDGRAEVYYDTGTFNDEITIHRAAPGWDQILDRRGVEVVLTNRRDPLAAALRRTQGWQLAFEGPVETVFTRAPVPPIPPPPDAVGVGR